MMKRELTVDQMEAVVGGTKKLDIDIDKDDNPFTIAYKVAKSDSAKEMASQLWDDAKGYATELGQRALGTAVLSTVSAWEKIKRWF